MMKQDSSTSTSSPFSWESKSQRNGEVTLGEKIFILIGVSLLTVLFVVMANFSLQALSAESNEQRYESMMNEE